MAIKKMNTFGCHGFMSLSESSLILCSLYNFDYNFPFNAPRERINFVLIT